MVRRRRLRFNPYMMTLLVALPVLCWVLATIVGATGLGRIEQLEREIATESIAAAALQERNELIAAEIVLLKNDATQIELLARYHFGMIKPGEVFIQVPFGN